MISLKIGEVYKSRSNGMVEYIGTDRYLGHTSLQFRRLSAGDMTYINPDHLDDFLEPQEMLESVKQQRDDLLAAQQDHQRLVRQLDVLLNGEAGAAQQASLCDLVVQVAKRGVIARSGAVPAGWQLVPADPTPEMLESGNEAYWLGRDNATSILGVYRAMLAAAKQEGGAS